jgi:hypothetical protein
MGILFLPSAAPEEEINLCEIPPVEKEVQTLILKGICTSILP